MTINEISLFNFGVYAGEHSINLKPKSKKAPVILVGALNGGGKTTLLDAIQLVLFGKLSKCSTRENYPYDEFLKRCITRGADTSKGSRVALTVRHGFDGTSHDFYIERSWYQTPKGVVEKLIVRRDGILDEDLSDSWLEYVDHFVPVGLAELFFFDGEKLEQIAQSNNAAKMLTTAINSLLGLDLVERLQKDLIIYEKDLQKSTKGKVEIKAINDLEAALNKAEGEAEALHQQKGKATTAVDRAEKTRSEAEVNFKKNGGEVFENRKALEAQKDILRDELKRIEDQMRQQAAGALPLLLVQKELGAILQQAEKESRAEVSELLQSTLNKRDRKLLQAIKSWKADPDILNKVKAHLTEDLEKRKPDDEKRYLDLDRSEYTNLQSMNSDVFEHERQKAQMLRSQVQQIAGKIQKLNDLLTQVPDDQAIADFAKDLARAKSDLQQSRADREIIEEQFSKKEREITEIKRQLKKKLDENVFEIASNKKLERKIQYSAKVRATMERFKATVLERKIRLIEELVLDSFQQLLRKKDLLSAIKIDPATYNMTLIGRNGEDIPPNRLSAGERQLLAVSTLWGLARASGRAMPNVIDTPMARLDSEHRTHLVENYFPNASHQVVILSTDEEIDDKYYPKIKSHVSRSYELAYCDKQQSSVIREGYFFK